MQKELKVILLVTHGVDLDNARVQYLNFEQQVHACFPTHAIHWVFTPMGPKQVLLEQGQFFSLTEAITLLCSQNFAQVLVQPLYVVPGQEFKRLQQELEQLSKLNNNLKISLGYPLLSSIKDVKLFTQKLFMQHNDLLAVDEAVVYVGHGSNDPDAGKIYSLLQQELKRCNKKFFFVNLLFQSDISATIKQLQESSFSSVHLVPLMTNPGKKTLAEIAGPGTSLCSKLMESGIDYTAHLHGLIENKNAQGLWLAHLQKANEKRNVAENK